uniref:Helicase C-terminal domain-containing protein n=1 Tax=Panagrolaimus sp. PS1159 TaxID=55785 RepID=A0AC35EWK2_9BILA
EFIDGKCRILFATLLLTRGTDIDVDFVVNYDFFLNYEQWVHRCGRTGRNGNCGIAVTFIDINNDEDYPKHIIVEEEGLPKSMKQMAQFEKMKKELNDQNVSVMIEEYGLE